MNIRRLLSFVLGWKNVNTYIYVYYFQIDTVGGCSVLLGLIAMAQDVECLYAGVKALVCVVRSNKAAQAEMDRRKGYQTLAMLLKRKKQLLNSHILHLIFGLVGTVDSQKETSSIPNLVAFQVININIIIFLATSFFYLGSIVVIYLYVYN